MLSRSPANLQRACLSNGCRSLPRVVSRSAGMRSGRRQPSRSDRDGPAGAGGPRPVVQRLLETDEAVPAPSAVDAIDRQDATLVVAFEVPDDLTTEQIILAVPGLALRRFDLFAGRRGMTRSAFLLEAANRWILQESAVNANTEVLPASAPEAAGAPAGYDIEATAAS